MVFAGEYLTASFPEVCSVFDDAVQLATASADGATPRVPDRIRHVSAGVASLHVDWPDPLAPGGWSPGEVRVLQVQSGLAPRTELMVAAPVTVPATGARRFLESLAAAVQQYLSLDARA